MEEYQKSPSLRSYEPAGEDCAEWLQMRQRSVASHVKTYARYLKGSGYELDDLIQEANLAIFSGWNAYDPATGVWVYPSASSEKISLFSSARAATAALSSHLSAKANSHLLRLSADREGFVLH